MKKTLTKIARLFGFTETETKVILLLIFVLMVGLTAGHFKDIAETGEESDFDYSREDSLFVSEANRDELQGGAEKNVEKDIDSQRELLDFSGDNSVKREENNLLLSFNSININTAAAEELSRLPGIGIKTAEKIMDYRNTYGPFKRVEDLLLVKGIGQAKLDAIRKYVFVE